MSESATTRASIPKTTIGVTSRLEPRPGLRMSFLAVKRGQVLATWTPPIVRLAFSATSGGEARLTALASYDDCSSNSGVLPISFLQSCRSRDCRDIQPSGRPHFLYKSRCP